MKLTAVCMSAALIAWAPPLDAQTISYRGFADLRGAVFPQDTVNDTENLVADAVGRVEVFVKPVPWLQLAAGSDLRANTHDQVDDSWKPDLTDRGILRPRLSVRRLAVTVSHGPLTVDAGKQLIRWGTTDIITPTDRFAPRDFMNVLDSDFLPVRGARAVVEIGSSTLDGVWAAFTPSRLPRLDQRWAPIQGIRLVDNEAAFSDRSQVGIRWARTGAGYDVSLSFFDGTNHLPNIVPIGAPFVVSAPSLSGIGLETPVVKEYPALRMYGGDVAVPTEWCTVKAETGIFTSSSPFTDDYILYVVQLERQTGEWVLVGGYAGEAVTTHRNSITFAPDRGTAKSIVARASYTIDVNRSAAIEGAVRQNGDGLYVKGEFSQARGRHWRATVAGVFIRGEPDDFIGQFRLNSHLTLGLRYSF